MRNVTDSHTHIGSYGEWDLPAEELLGWMDSAGVGTAVTGDLSGNRKGAFGTERAAEQVCRHRDRLRLMLWVNPGVNDLAAAERLLREDRELFACMKVHPQTSRIPLGDDRYLPYLKLCEEYGLPFAAHTERDADCGIDRLAVMAETCPGVSFIAVHMELRSDHERAIGLIAKHANLYGDTTFVPVGDVIRAVETCGSGKILFGTDAPVAGGRSYVGLNELKEALTARFGRAAADQVLGDNCRRLMKLG